MIHRRGLLVGLGSLLGAPAIIPYGRLMRVKAVPDLMATEWDHLYKDVVAMGYKITRERIGDNLYSGVFAGRGLPYWVSDTGEIYSHPSLVLLGRGL